MRSAWGYFKENWPYLLATIPAFTAGFAVRYYIQYRQENPGSHSAPRISEYKSQMGSGDYYSSLPGGGGAGTGRDVASSSKKPGKGSGSQGKSEGKSEELPKNKKGSAPRADSGAPGTGASAAGATAAAGAAGAAAALKELLNQEGGMGGGPQAQASAAPGEQAKSATPEPSAAPSITPAALPSSSPDSFAAVEIPEEKMVSEDGSCRSYEGHGDASDRIAVAQKDWDIVMDQYHEAKRDLLSWLERRKAAFSPKTFDHMSNLVRNLKIQRPPTLEEPDLSWRGIGVYVKTPDGKNLMRMGGGFVNLAKKDANRAKFELARLIAHTWSPCDLKKENLGEPWKELLACMKVVEEDACSRGTFSEAGWAFSSVLATITNPPGCTLPALKDPQMAACLKTLDTSKFSFRPWERIKIAPPKYTQAKR